MGTPVIVNDVGPRDGLQNQKKILEPEQRVALVRSLLAAGMRHVEVAAFVHPRAVPAMAGAAEVLAGLAGEPLAAGAELSVLIPNMKGYELARDAGARAVAMVLYGTDEMAEANVRMSKAAAEDATEAILERARADGVTVMGTISVAFECPFAGAVDTAVIHAATDRIIALGIDH